MKRSPIKSKRAKPRTFKTPRCTIRGCDNAQNVKTWCIKHAEKKADDRFSIWIRNRDGRCTAAGMFDLDCIGPLQAAHVVGRGRHSVRFDEDNVHALCAGHHMLVDQKDREAFKVIWVKSLIGDERFDTLMYHGSQTVARAFACSAELAKERKTT